MGIGIGLLLVVAVGIAGGCETTTERISHPAVFGSPDQMSQTQAPAASRREPEKPGWWERMADHVTERECNVSRFTCPYGLGPAGEPCECTDGRGVVLKGTTIK